MPSTTFPRLRTSSSNRNRHNAAPHPRPLVKTAIKLILLVGLAVYLVFAFVDFSRHGDKSPCTKVNFSIADSAQAGFITVQEAENILRRAHVYPIGRPMERVDGHAIEQALRANSFIDSVSCYKSPGGIVNVLIVQRLPLLRVMPDGADDYYLDERGHRMNPRGYSADLPVATGHITPDFARRELVKMGRFLRNDDFWNSQIEQIYVSQKGELTLVPRVGSHLIRFGRTDSLQQKFHNLYAFYEKVLPQVGWNKYAEISVEHVSQIIGRKAQKE